jgi:hypothetical protein
MNDQSGAARAARRKNVSAVPQCAPCSAERRSFAAQRLERTDADERHALPHDPGAPVGVDVEFDVARDGTVRGFAASTEYGVIEVKRVR